jgi:hypothetical protein
MSDRVVRGGDHTSSRLRPADDPRLEQDRPSSHLALPATRDQLGHLGGATLHWSPSCCRHSPRREAPLGAHRGLSEWGLGKGETAAAAARALLPPCVGERRRLHTEEAATCGPERSAPSPPDRAPGAKLSGRSLIAESSSDATPVLAGGRARLGCGRLNRGAVRAWQSAIGCSHEPPGEGVQAQSQRGQRGDCGRPCWDRVCGPYLTMSITMLSNLGVAHHMSKGGAGQSGDQTHTLRRRAGDAQRRHA